MSAVAKVQQKTDMHKCAKTMCNGFLMICNKKHRPFLAGASELRYKKDIK